METTTTTTLATTTTALATTTTALETTALAATTTALAATTTASAATATTLTTDPFTPLVALVLHLTRMPVMTTVMSSLLAALVAPALPEVRTKPSFPELWTKLSS